MKAIILVLVGAVGYHLLANAEDRSQLIYTVQDTVSSTAATVADVTRPDLITTLKNR